MMDLLVKTFFWERQGNKDRVRKKNGARAGAVAQLLKVLAALAGGSHATLSTHIPVAHNCLHIWLQHI